MNKKKTPIIHSMENIIVYISFDGETENKTIIPHREITNIDIEHTDKINKLTICTRNNHRYIFENDKKTIEDLEWSIINKYK